MNEDEWEKVKKQIWMIDGQPRQLDKLVGRRKKKRSYEYEVSTACGEVYLVDGCYLGRGGRTMVYMQCTIHHAQRLVTQPGNRHGCCGCASQHSHWMHAAGSCCSARSRFKLGRPSFC